MGLIMLILIGTVPTAYALNRALPESRVASFQTISEAASKVIEGKAAGYNVIGNPRPAVTTYIASHQISEGTYPSLAVLVRDIAKQVPGYGSLAKIPADRCRQYAKRHVSRLRGDAHPRQGQGERALGRSSSTSSRPIRASSTPRRSSSRSG